MGIELDANGVMRKAGNPVIRFRNVEGDETVVEIINKRDVNDQNSHREGDRVVEVSVEAFGELMALVGFFPVDPRTDGIVIPDSLLPAGSEYADEVPGDRDDDGEGEDA